MKVVIYSGGYVEENEDLDYELLALLDNEKPRVTFIPSSFEEAEDQFDDFIFHFEKYGWDDFLLFPVDRPFTKYSAHNALKRDLVFLSGGNTFYFLKHLKKSGLAGQLKKYAEDGGVICGESAGGIILTPSITTASYPAFDADDNEVGLKNWKGLGLIPFEFFPHFCNTKRYIHALNYASQESHVPIFAVPDGNGIIIDGDKTSFVGPQWGFFRGKKFVI
jgi:dipeptidase E